MYLLVNLEGHLSQMGEIIAGLVNQYSVPISIVDRVEKACPRCSSSSNNNDPSSPSPSTSITNEKTSQNDELLLGTSINIKDDHEMDIGCEVTVREALGVGRRTAAKHSALIRALEKKVSVSPDANKIEKINVKTEPDESMNQCINEKMDEIPCSSSQSPSHSDSASFDDQASFNDDGQYGASLESLHPNLLACLMSSTPNVFADDRLSPLTSGPPSDPSPEAKPLNDKNFDFHSLNIPDALGITSPGRQPGHLVTASGKIRRGRIVYNTRDLEILENFYEQDANACADPLKKKQLMELLGIDAIRLKVWFQNRRRKDRIQWLKDNTEDGTKEES